MYEGKTPKARVKLFLIHSIKTDGEVTISNAELAATLGTVTRTVTRALAELRDEGRILERWDSTGLVRTFSAA